MRVIGIYRDSKQWVASFLLDEDFDRSLFGTTEIPTPFLRAADEAKVRAAIESKNPGYEVIRRQDV